MNVHYSKILLFFLLLNILVTLYHVNTHKKPSITTHNTTIYKPRLLSECDIQSSIYNNDADIKSVREKFDRQTSQRLREYDERMQDKRQKREEERDKNIQKIIEKDKMEKSLAEKVEIGCLKCGCALGGVAASIGIFGTVAVNELTKAAMTAALATAKEAGIAAGKIVGDAHGMNIVILGFKHFGVEKLGIEQFERFFTTKYYINVEKLADIIDTKLNATCSTSAMSSGKEAMCTEIRSKLGILLSGNERAPPGKEPIINALKQLAEKAKDTAVHVTETTTEQVTTAAIETNTEIVEAASSQLYSAIGYSVLAILIIVLVMIIIYLVLRYRRKKKMNKKAQYAKLLNQ
ncbi:rifin PIR protein, putative [Plasmodium reichenowi]|uniref:Rifin PIR protein, putative n=1 Tax=Plasmodium reichenowi TaxID=5854 RepID=A0A2P9DCF4_PLARE|nr:rifin PIR protein, putative [Plasmodium reichenowi]